MYNNERDPMYDDEMFKWCDTNSGEFLVSKQQNKTTDNSFNILFHNA